MKFFGGADSVLGKMKEPQNSDPCPEGNRVIFNDQNVLRGGSDSLSCFWVSGRIILTGDLIKCKQLFE